MLGWLFRLGEPRWELTKCPRWINPNSDTLHSAWDDNKVLIYRGRTYEYRVTPGAHGQGNYVIAKVERRKRRRRRRA